MAVHLPLGAAIGAGGTPSFAELNGTTWGSLSVVCWARWSAAWALNRGPFGIDSTGLVIPIGISGNPANYSVFSATVGAGAVPVVYQNGAIPANSNWINFIIIHDPSVAVANDRIKIYFNGAEQTFAVLIASDATNVGPLGSDVLVCGENGVECDGMWVAEAAIYDKALSSSEISLLANSKYSVRNVAISNMIVGTRFASSDHPNYTNLGYLTDDPFTVGNTYEGASGPPGIIVYLNRLNLETPPEHFSDGMRRLRIRNYDTDWGAEKYRWQLRIANQIEQYYPYPLDVYTDEPYWDVYLPPFTDMEARVLQVGSEDEHWGAWFSIPYTHLTSYDKARILSGQDVIISTELETSEGATIINE